MLVGSLRRDSHNRKLAVAVTRPLAERVDFDWVEIGELPHYNGDLEEQRPAGVDAFTRRIAAADGILIVTPEYNRSIPGVLKNAIDWGSKPKDANVWADKVIALLGVSIGAIATAAAQLHLRQVLGALNALVMGGEAYVTYKPELFAPDGSIAVEATRVFVDAYVARFVALVERLRPHTFAGGNP